MSARDLLVEATRRLAEAGVDTPRVDAELLLADLLDVPRGRLASLDGVGETQARAYREWITRRAAREPLQHIVGHAPFRYIEVPVGPGVFVPRPETELLVDAVLPALTGPEPVAVDLCSGSGAVALAIAHEVPGARVLAVELPGPSGEWLRRNTASGRVEPLLADVTAGPLLPELHGRVDAVTANPPYVPSAARVSAEALQDPSIAVYGGEDGLAVIPDVIARAAELLRPGGAFAMEHDVLHAPAIPELLRLDGRWVDVADNPDLTGRPRYVVARRAAPVEAG